MSTLFQCTCAVYIYPAQLNYSSGEQALSHGQHSESDDSLVGLGAGANDPYHDISDQNDGSLTNEEVEGYGDNGDLLSDDNDRLQPYDETVATNHGQYIANLLQ